MNIFKAWYRNTLVPRIVFIPFWLSWLVLSLVQLVRLVVKPSRPENKPSTLCIEAGIKGWESIEFKELYASACEYLNIEQVHKIEVTPDEDYFFQIKKALDITQPTHYLYDPRTGSQHGIKGLWQSFNIAVLLCYRKITPIVLLTDLAVRTWRVQSAVVTAKTGAVVIFMSPRKIYPIFSHRRLVGPSLMPLSMNTMKFLDSLPKASTNTPSQAIFTGSLYEPRTSILQEIQAGLEQRGFTLEIKGRELGSARISDVDYWVRLKNADLVVTTANQMEQSGTDWTWIPHFLYRYLEVISCGTLLVAPEVPGIHRFFAPNEHFVSFSSVQEAIEAIEYYLINQEKREEIAKDGKHRAKALVEARSFWLSIDVALGKESLT
ncbi:glycosyltransferase [Laspinema sp. D1]|uniref:Glycosyltransferase n=1 Tax=Laspinema palackyanum D2a TaxID=2953684 RepID=A0ABT2MUV1_9CYAN|nr:glycosyltransferase [Laspinema sp. D2a]